jgi:large subunit ribosomal protein L6
MSRIGNKPIAIPNGVTVEKTAGGIRVKGPKGTLNEALPAAIGVEVANGEVVFRRPDETGPTRALHGLVRALVANMVKGVTEGFSRKLTLVGVGYRAQVAGDKVNLSLGFSHPVVHQLPKGVTALAPVQTEIVLKGIDKQQVGQVAAEIRAYRPPEPYKGKGVRYADERVVIKETKKK